MTRLWVVEILVRCPRARCDVSGHPSHRRRRRQALEQLVPVVQSHEGARCGPRGIAGQRTGGVGTSVRPELKHSKIRTSRCAAGFKGSSERSRNRPGSNQASASITSLYTVCQRLCARLVGDTVQFPRRGSIGSSNGKDDSERSRRYKLKRRWGLSLYCFGTEAR